MDAHFISLINVQTEVVLVIQVIAVIQCFAEGIKFNVKMDPVFLKTKPALIKWDVS